MQNAVQLASPQLPAAVRQLGISIVKSNSDILGVVGLSSSDTRFDAAYLTNYMKLYVEDELKGVQGVGNATTFGGLQFSMLIQLDPDKMAQLGVTVNDVAAAVREQNATNPAGEPAFHALPSSAGPRMRRAMMPSTSTPTETPKNG